MWQQQNACNCTGIRSSSEHMLTEILLRIRKTLPCLQFSSFAELVCSVASDSCSWLIVVEPSVVFFCRISSASRFRGSCFQRCVSAHHGYKECLFDLVPVSLNQSDPFPLTAVINKAFSLTELPLIGCFFVFHTFLCKF